MADDGVKNDGDVLDELYNTKPMVYVPIPQAILEDLLGGAAADTAAGTAEGTTATGAIPEADAEATATTDGSVTPAEGAAQENTTVTNATDHGAGRMVERNITDVDAQNAIQSAEQNGQVTTQIGKYGTPQNVYQGTNGVTVVVETSGRNAGKVISVWRK